MGSHDADHLRAEAARARQIAEAGDADAAVRIYDAALRRIHDSEDPSLRAWQAALLQNKRIVLEQAGDETGAIAVARQTAECFRHNPPQDFPFIVGDALFAVALRLKHAGRSDEAVDVLSELIDIYADSEDPDVQAKVALAGALQTELLVGDARFRAVIAAGERLIVQLRHVPDEATHRRVTDMMCGEATALAALGDSTRALAIVDEVIARGDDATVGAWPRAHKAKVLAELGDAAGAEATRREILERYRDDPNPAVRAIVQDTRRELGGRRR